MQERQWIIYAVNVHTGGGKVLLDSILSGQALGPVYAVFADHRYETRAPADFQIFYSKNSFFERLKAEFKLHRLVKSLAEPKNFQILFFGNLPPIIAPQVSSILYLQNCYLTRQMPLPNDSYFEKARNFAESLWLRWFSKNVDEIWVQTPWMERMTRSFLPGSPLRIRPILPQFIEKEAGNSPRVFDFIYVGSLSLKKRLHFFLTALSLLSPKLSRNVKIAIVLDSPKVDFQIPELKNIEYDISFKVPHQIILESFARSKVFVATSAYESFCLPLYEANFYGCSILAPVAGYTESLEFEFTKYQLDDPEDLAAKMLRSLDRV